MLKLTFSEKFNDVLSLMMRNNLRKDIDDTLLEKLLNVIRSGYINCMEADLAYLSEKASIQKYYFKRGLLQRTKVSDLFEKSITSLLDKDDNISISTTCFAIHLLGIFLEDRNIFLELENHTLLVSFAAACKKISNFSPSVQDAVLSSLICISNHAAGNLYLIQKDLITSAFESFSSASYYVRKTARLFFVTLFTSLLNSFTLEKSRLDVIKLGMDNTIKRLIGGLEISSQESQTFNECCILTLNSVLEVTYMKGILNGDYHLAESITKVFNYYDFQNETSDTLIELFVNSFYYNEPGLDSVLMKVIGFLFEQKLAKSLMYLISLMSRDYRQNEIVFKGCVNVVLLPLSIVSNYPISETNEKLFQVSWADYHQVVANKMSDKNDCMQLLRTSLILLTEQLCYMNSEMLANIVFISNKMLLCDSSSEVQHGFQNQATNNRKVQLSILELLSCFTKETVNVKLSKELKDLLLESLLSILEKSMYDNCFISQVLKLIKAILIINADAYCKPSDEVRDHLVGVIERKLLDTRWPVVDSTLDVVGQLISGKDSKIWEESICNFRIHTAIWDIAIVGKSEGYVRASALRVVVALCLSEFLWEKIKELRQVNEGKMVKILCKLANHPDVFIQREAVTSLLRWLQSKHPLLSSTKKAKVFTTLTTAVKTSLDWDTKLIALRTWQFFAEKDINFQSLPDIERSLQSLCDSGYSSSLLFALADHDNTVQFEAAQILFIIRKALIDHGHCQSSMSLDDIDDDDESEKLPSTDSQPVMISREEREAAMDEVLDMYTINRIKNVLKTTDDDDIASMPDSPSQCDMFFGNMDSDTSDVEVEDASECSLSKFWKSLWSDRIEWVLKHSIKSSDVYCDDPVSLLEDIIAAKIISTLADPVQYQDADCY